jgi:hypothetical protein
LDRAKLIVRGCASDNRHFRRTSCITHFILEQKRSVFVPFAGSSRVGQDGCAP